MLTAKQLLQEWYDSPEPDDSDYESEQDRLQMQFELAKKDNYARYIEYMDAKKTIDIFDTDEKLNIIESFDEDIDKTLSRFYHRVIIELKQLNNSMLDKKYPTNSVARSPAMRDLQLKLEKFKEKNRDKLNQHNKNSLSIAKTIELFNDYLEELALKDDCDLYEEKRHQEYEKDSMNVHFR